jgi:hypothetical protein
MESWPPAHFLLTLSLDTDVLEQSSRESWPPPQNGIPLSLDTMHGNRFKIYSSTGMLSNSNNSLNMHLILFRLRMGDCWVGVFRGIVVQAARLAAQKRERVFWAKTLGTFTFLANAVVGNLRKKLCPCLRSFGKL